MSNNGPDDEDHRALLRLRPGGLVNRDEPVRFEAQDAGELVLRQGIVGDFKELGRVLLKAGETWVWPASDCGLFLAEFTAANGEVARRPVAVVSSEWAVCQITVGAFTAEDFSDLIHGAGLAADYYVELPKAGGAEAFTAADPRWRAFERLHGDAIHPHAMANALGGIVPELAHDDPNWDSLPLAGIETRLRALQGWWWAQGYAELDRIATYTPSNPFIQACRATGIRVVHSLCPEQNWSDGEWAINHWGMPTAPFWIAPDDFRKAGARDAQGVLGITMNHYQVLLPHLTHWGDFVLSPSHFTRWIRAADSGGESMRFRQFLMDTVRGGTSLTGAPFFFVAGFEFGRTFGTANMTAYNRAGLGRLIELAKKERLVFATSTDVRAYHDRHVPGLAERVFRQRDNWVGVTINDKPGQAGDSVVIERGAYKALVREKANLPYFYYDYRRPWDFATGDLEAPEDFAAACAGELRVSFPTPARVLIEAAQPLLRTIPVVLWDATVTGAAFPILPVRGLDDNRTITVLEVPAGWQGRAEIALRPVDVPAGRRDGRWTTQTFGTGVERHTYLHLDAPLIRDVIVPVALKKKARVNDAQQSLGEQTAGIHALTFGFLRSWYRFEGCGVEDLEPASDIEARLQGSDALLPSEAEAARLSQRHGEWLDAVAWAHPALRDGRPVLSLHCGAALALGTRSRAEAWDRAVAHAPGVTAREFSDGVIAFGPGQSFWYHPRGLHFRIDGLLAAGGEVDCWTVLLHTFDPLGLEVRYRVLVGAAGRKAGIWTVPVSPGALDAFFPVEISRRDFDAHGCVVFHLLADQTALVHWHAEGGFIAALHALWIGAPG
ncbi:MAG: hypothetical protein K0R17_3320 [Rariglobus sp.]|jgi:hypothetical protein|nr:hypothetical protein [Rariglobus sp.]